MAGYSRNGLPYNKLSHRPRILVVFSEALLRETAKAFPIPGSSSMGKGHAPTGKQFGRDGLMFLREDMPALTRDRRW
jgi:hypothetical protein